MPVSDSGAAGVPRLRGQTSLRRDFFLTAAVQISVAGASFVQYGLIRRRYGLEGLGDFSQLMRVRGILEFAVLLLLPMALTRELAMLPQNAGSHSRRRMIDTGVGLGALCVLACISLLLALPQWSAFVLFGNVSFVPWIPPFCFLLGGYAMCLMVSATARGLQIFSTVNLLQFLYVAAVPIVFLVFAWAWPMATIVTAMGIGALVFAVVFFIRLRPPLGEPLSGDEPLAGYFDTGVKLLKYGIPRLSVIVCMGIHGLILSWLVSSRGESSLLAALNALVGVLSVSTLLVSPLGLITLPHLSRLIAVGKRDEAGRKTSQMLTFALLMGGLSSLGALALLRPVVRLWLGPDILQYSTLFLAVSMVMPGCIVLEIMRSPLDSISVVPWNALTYLSGAAVTVLVFVAASSGWHCSIEVSITLSWIAGTCAAAGVSVWIGRVLLGFRISDYVLKICGCWWFAAVAFQAMGYGWLPAFWHIVTGLLFILGYLMILLRSAPSWLINLVPQSLQPILARFVK